LEKIIEKIHFDDLSKVKKAYRGDPIIPFLIDKNKKINEKRDKKEIKCYLPDCNNYFWSKVSHSRHMNNLHGITPKEYKSRFPHWIKSQHQIIFGGNPG
jgi:uncharacterized C2H2 Zn-finger protein